MKPNEIAQIEFIKDYLRKGQQRKEILQVFIKNYKTGVKTFDSRLKLAKEALQSELTKITEETEKGIQKEIEARKAKILTTIERKEILSQIAKGELTTTREVSTPMGVVVPLQEKPSYSDRKAAIAELNKMDGDYAPEKSQIEQTGEIKIDFRDAQ